jgi:hypothetical protein
LWAIAKSGVWRNVSHLHALATKVAAPKRYPGTAAARPPARKGLDCLRPRRDGRRNALGYPLGAAISIAGADVQVDTRSQVRRSVSRRSALHPRSRCRQLLTLPPLLVYIAAQEIAGGSSARHPQCWHNAPGAPRSSRAAGPSAAALERLNRDPISR